MKKNLTVMKLPRKERGAVLVVSLIVLLVVTLLGVGGLETAVFQERMAANAQNKNQSFQDTASLLEEILRDDTIINSELKGVLNMAMKDKSNVVSYDGATDPVSAEYVVTYMGESGLFAREGKEVSSKVDIPQRRFELRVSTERKSTQSGATHIQGFVPY